MTDVLVIGAGPTGLTAAAEAVRHGLSVRIVDANAQRSIHSKALVLHSRSLEVFTDMGFVQQVLQNGQEFRALNLYADGKTWTRIDFRTLDWQDAIYPFWLSLPQSETERLLEGHLNRLGVQVERRTELTALSQQGERVQATLRRTDQSGAVVGEEVVEAPWLIGCDGARSKTRNLCQIPYEGTAEDELFILGDVQIEWAEAIVNPNGALHRRYGAIAEALYLIRPDQHIGYRSQPVRVERFRAYVEGILLPTA